MADPKIAFEITIDPEHEGGFQKMPNDRGNWTGGKVGVGELKGTKYGISAHEFPTLNIENLTPGQAIAIYTEKYWKQYYSQIESQFVANKLADLGVLFGVGEAVKLLQAVLRVDPDGFFGPETLAAVNDADPDSLLTAYKTIFVRHAQEIGANSPTERQFLFDWMIRINS